MSKEAEQKKFQRGLLGIVFGFSYLSLLVTCFCVTRVDPNAIHHVCRDEGDWTFVDEAGLRGDASVIANHCIDEGYVQKPEGMKVVEISALKGYGNAAVIARTSSLAVPEGQCLLPYHMSEKLQTDNIQSDALVYELD